MERRRKKYRKEHKEIAYKGNGWRMKGKKKEERNKGREKRR